MSWTAIIPFKGRGARKTRLAGLLPREALEHFSHRMFERTCDVLAECDSIGKIVVLSDVRPSGWNGIIVHDQGRGLNAELGDAVFQASMQRVLVIHADLPLFVCGDVEALLREADGASIVIAPDRHGTGTNALALTEPQEFLFRFGPGSMALHIEASEREARILRNLGLSFDIDTPDDYLEACRIAPETMRLFVT